MRSVHVGALLQLILLSSAAGSSSEAAEAKTTTTPNELGGEWISLSPHQEFQPARLRKGQHQDEEKRAARLRKAQQRFLSQETSSSTDAATSWLVDSSDTHYDGYQQAWRYLGFLVDCHAGDDYQANQRRLEDAQDDGDDGGVTCQRYLLWAAYVDLDYQGGGIGEYQYYDTVTNQWDTSACATATRTAAARGSYYGTETVDSEQLGRCAKMDCHLPDSENWQLLGFFKEAGYTDWLEQLFKHSGYCLWNNEDTFETMYGNFGAWPEGCTETGVYAKVDSDDGSTQMTRQLYYDLKPIADGNMTVGLYADSGCSMDYTGKEYSAEGLLGGNDGNGGNFNLFLGNNAAVWNAAMSPFKVCQPCRTYNLNYDANEDDRRRLEDYDPNNGLFQCDDAAGYTNINQCMKFRTQTDMEYATTQDIVQASEQGSLLSTTVRGVTFGWPLSSIQRATEEAQAQKGFIPVSNATRDKIFFATSLVVFFAGALFLVSTLVWIKNAPARSPSHSLKEELLRREKGEF